MSPFHPMPFQNTGTLLENIVLLEAARGLFAQTTGIVEWASAFSMPPLTVWRRAEKYASTSPLFSIERLNAVAETTPSNSTSYEAFLHHCLQHDRTKGPNGALLVGLLAQQLDRSLRAWVEDVPMPTSHYGPVRAPLEALGTYVAALGPTSGSPYEAIDVCTTAYPDCLADLSRTLHRWRTSDPSESDASPARLGYLDPNVYHFRERHGPQTSASDHRRWLRTLASGARSWAVSVHFSSNRDRTALHNSFTHMHEDGTATGYSNATSYCHNAHSATVLVCGPTPEAADQYIEQVRTQVQTVWEAWRAATPQPSTSLQVYANMRNG